MWIYWIYQEFKRRYFGTVSCLKLHSNSTFSNASDPFSYFSISRKYRKSFNRYILIQYKNSIHFTKTVMNIKKKCNQIQTFVAMVICSNTSCRDRRSLQSTGWTLFLYRIGKPTQKLNQLIWAKQLIHRHIYISI